MMTKPDFTQMTHQALRAYILAHRDDDDAIEALIERRNPTAQDIDSPKAMRI
jgi:hypothetical protein